MARAPTVDSTPPPGTARAVNASQRRATRPRLAFLALLLTAALLSFLYLRLTSDLATSSYDLAQLEQEQQAWQVRNEELRLQVSQLSSLDRVAQLAAARLHMGPPDRTAYVSAPAAAPVPAFPTVAPGSSVVATPKP
jgi:cell division protein FtsL